MSSLQEPPQLDPTRLAAQYATVRRFSERLAEPLSPEDCAMQSMPDVSPTRWHLAHTTWFFETFLLKSQAGYRVYDERFEYLFNSYYNAVGQQFPRHRRGQISRPGLAETMQYRHYVDQQLCERLANGDCGPAAWAILQLGLQHEQQHQELMLTDIKHVLFGNPLYPAYDQSLAADGDVPQRSQAGATPRALQWQSFAGGISEAGWPAADGFSFDNEQPRHSVLLQPHQIATRCVSNGEYLDFV
ncbi:MAG: DinB family protein [Planctomycetales bacterium]|nr:DinB family protein [Planctomycetales bacterium]